MRTLRETITHIRDEAVAGRLGAHDAEGCVYEDDRGRKCAIGCLLTLDQLTFIHTHHLNSGCGAPHLEDELHFVADLGLEVDQAQALQHLHDEDDMPRLIRRLDSILAEGEGTLRANGLNVWFNLGGLRT